jgi:hypothetical protein
VDCYGSGTGNSRDLTCSLTALPEVLHGALQYDQVCILGSVAVPIAVNKLKVTFFLKLLNQVLVESYLELRRQCKSLGFDHLYFDRSWLGRVRVALSAQESSTENNTPQTERSCNSANASHHCCSPVSKSLEASSVLEPVSLPRLGVLQCRRWAFKRNRMGDIWIMRRERQRHD